MNRAERTKSLERYKFPIQYLTLYPIDEKLSSLLTQLLLDEDPDKSPSLLISSAVLALIEELTDLRTKIIVNPDDRTPHVIELPEQRTERSPLFKKLLEVLTLKSHFIGIISSATAIQALLELQRAFTYKFFSSKEVKKIGFKKYIYIGDQFHDVLLSDIDEDREYLIKVFGLEQIDDSDQANYFNSAVAAILTALEEQRVTFTPVPPTMEKGKQILHPHKIQIVPRDDSDHQRDSSQEAIIVKILSVLESKGLMKGIDGPEHLLPALLELEEAVNTRLFPNWKSPATRPEYKPDNPKSRNVMADPTLSASGDSSRGVDIVPAIQSATPSYDVLSLLGLTLYELQDIETRLNVMLAFDLVQKILTRVEKVAEKSLPHTVYEGQFRDQRREIGNAVAVSLSTRTTHQVLPLLDTLWNGLLKGVAQNESVGKLLSRFKEIEKNFYEQIENLQHDEGSLEQYFSEYGKHQTDFRDFLSRISVTLIELQNMMSRNTIMLPFDLVDRILIHVDREATKDGVNRSSPHTVYTQKIENHKEVILRILGHNIEPRTQSVISNLLNEIITSAAEEATLSDLREKLFDRLAQCIILCEQISHHTMTAAA